MHEGIFKPAPTVGVRVKEAAAAVAAIACVALLPVRPVAANSGETGAAATAFEDVTQVSTADCNTIRNQIATGFSGDWIFICYVDQAGNPACGQFATQANALGFCQDRFPNGISARLGTVLKTNVRILGIASEITTGLIGTLPSAVTPTQPADVVCGTYNPDPGTSGTPGRQVCVQIEPKLSPSDPSATSCPSSGPALFQISPPTPSTAPSCTTLKSIVETATGQTVSDVWFGWMTDVGPPPPATPVARVGRAGSEGLLLCGAPAGALRKATCLPADVPTGFPGGVQVQFQLPAATIQEQPDCRTFRGVRYC